MSCPTAELQKKADVLRTTWQAYRARPGFEQFVEFAITQSSFAEFLQAKGLSGLHQTARDLEQQALGLFGDELSHPIAPTELGALDDRLQGLLQRIAAYISQSSHPLPDRRAGEVPGSDSDLGPARRIWYVGQQVSQWQELMLQLGYFGIDVEQHPPTAQPDQRDEPFIVLFDTQGLDAAQWTEHLRALRQRFAASKLIALCVPSDFASLQLALSAGCDFCFPQGTPQTTVMGKILELNGSEEEDPYRVLVVEDSLTATKLIQRSLNESGVESLAIAHPRDVLTTLHRYQPDLILMDMYMPGCTGVEAARVIRQHAEFLSIPIVYLSGETDVALQIDALRLGGDHFLTKPFNPVILNAIVKSKIERYRALRRSMFHDSLTGLLNHTSSKQRLDSALGTAAAEHVPLAAAMIDIDHFKKVNDNYGHPVGDQIIRSLAWLLKQRLRKTDIVGRYGGEEFMVALPGASSAQALQVLDRIRHDFAQIRHPFGGSWFNTTFSCGIASFPHISHGEALVKAADEALYQAKRAGRDRIVTQD
ncbi:GGDEF domain-containing response regulator [Chitinimonas taiwanensis]|jgi:diguanylate cyclase (GGDEF)-like protein|uniref:diguanylate cyclase n=1 Tax=Chitinimonas taiwanensis DSM 18899 TaxID=1121279 RepID=A0A1K2HQC3_9NEIS|nr:diguanylate cyclase [Chitinimonas taiwanensis]SFZ78958.1 diguanylate cyclase (GGDEF) domain-containing protein [Chitinimonas taiwanensis DSM 18899]